MANIVKLNYTANEINEKLGKIDELGTSSGKTAYMHVFTLSHNMSTNIFRVYLISTSSELLGYGVFNRRDQADELSYLVSGWDYDNGGVIHSQPCSFGGSDWETGDVWTDYGLTNVGLDNENLIINEENFTLSSEKII